MSNDLTISSFTKSLSELDQLDTVVSKLMKTKHYQKIGEDGVYAILSKARSMDFEPFEALNGAFYVVQGRVGMSTETMAYLVRKAGHSVKKDPKSNNTICILTGTRKDNGDTWTVSFSMEDARRAGLIKQGGNYDKYPAVMLYNRAMSMLFRQLFPDLSRGAGYTHEELKEIDINEKINSKTGEIFGGEVFEHENFEVITSQQADDLRTIFNECPLEYLESVFQGLEKMNHQVQSIEQIPSYLYDRIKSSALKARINIGVAASADELNSKIFGNKDVVNDDAIIEPEVEAVAS